MRKLLVAAVLFSAFLHAQTPAKRPMTFVDMVAMKRVADPQVSPSGKWVLFSVTEVSLEKNSKVNSLWIVPLDGSAPEHRLAGAPGHSQLDYRLDVSQGFELFTALQLLHVPSKMLYFPDEGHWVLKPKNSELWYRTVNDWCDQWTQSGKYAVDQGSGIREQGSGNATAKAGK